MQTILTEEEYKQIIRRIALISSSVMTQKSETEELKELSTLAMDYEYRKYDFTSAISASANTIATNQAIYFETRN